MKTPSIIPLAILLLLMCPVWTVTARAVDAPPTEVRIDILSQDYAAVDFDHAGHVGMIGDCAECHHHTAGTPAKRPDCFRCHSGVGSSATASCKGCHPAQPFSSDYLREKDADLGRYHIDKPGLKAAYHRGCVGCHEGSGGPTGCLDCHERTDAGDRLYRTGQFRPAPTHDATGH